MQPLYVGAREREFASAQNTRVFTGKWLCNGMQWNAGLSFCQIWTQEMPRRYLSRTSGNDGVLYLHRFHFTFLWRLSFPHWKIVYSSSVWPNRKEALEKTSSPLTCPLSSGHDLISGFQISVIRKSALCIYKHFSLLQWCLLFLSCYSLWKDFCSLSLSE